MVDVNHTQKGKKMNASNGLTCSVPEAINGIVGQRKIKTIVLDDPNLAAMAELTLELEGTASLIMHRFGPKCTRMILDVHMGRAKAKKAPKNPEADFLDAIHFIGEEAKTAEELPGKRYGFPAVAFKSAATRCAKLSGSIMTDVRCMFFVQTDWGEYVEIKTDAPPTMHQAPVRFQNTVDIRFRPEFKTWRTTLRIIYNMRQVTAEQLTSWFLNAGISNGIGEWRPAGRQSSGVFGTWKITRAQAAEPVLDAPRRGAKLDE